MRLLLINPKFSPTFWTFDWTHRKLFTEIEYPVAPLGLASVAALTPGHWEITIVDENVEEIDWDFPADIVGVAGMSSQYARQSYVLQRFREKGRYVVAGGNHASLLPEQYEDSADTVIAGEAEHTWPQFCRDFEEGAAQSLYRETGDVDLIDSPTPRFDLLKLERYSLAAVQFSRGCPFRCEFCDIIVVFGRKPRTKSTEQIGAELDALRQQGVRNVFFVDDNLIGHKPRAKELLRFLAEYQRGHNYRFHFGTEASINLAGDAELLELFRDANFGWIFVGLESPSEDALKETLKFQNTKMDLIEAVERIHAKGIDVNAGFIVGFDADDESIFERQFQFIQKSGISIPMVALLTAIARTPLWTRLEQAGRLRAVAVSPTALLDGAPSHGTAPSTNFIPLQMSYEALVTKYADLVRRLFAERAIFERLRNRSKVFGDPVLKFGFSPLEALRILMRFLFHGVLLGGPSRWYYFMRSLALTRGSIPRITSVVDFWASSVALRAFVDETFQPDAVATSLAAETLETYEAPVALVPLRDARGATASHRVG